MDEIGLTALKEAFKVASERSEWSTVAVAIGVAIEFVALFVFSKEMPRAEKIVMAGATLLIVIGCVGEYVFGSNATSAAQRLQKASDMQIASAVASAATLGVSFGNLDQFVINKTREFKAATDELKLETRDLNKVHGEALKAAQGTKKDLADVEILLKSEQEMHQKIQELTKPRTLSTDQQKRIADKLKQFSGTTFEVITYPTLVEPVGLSNVLTTTLQSAGWVFNPNKTPDFLISPIAGVFVGIDKDSGNKSAAIGNAILNALTSEGISTTLQYTKFVKETIPVTVQISVGLKP